MIKEIKQDGEARMQKTLEALETNQVASVNVEDSRTLLVQPFERSMVQAIDKAIREADLGLNPMTADVIRVPMPALTEDTRRDMQKLARSEAENSRVSIRNIRRDMMNDIKELAKEKEISEDDERRASDDIQKITDKYIETIDSRLSKKESDLMEV